MIGVNLNTVKAHYGDLLADMRILNEQITQIIDNIFNEYKRTIF